VTFSIIARDARTGDLGVASQSKFLAVGAVVPHARADVGAVATQALANGSFGPDGLAFMAGGAGADRALDSLLEHDDRPDRRQVILLDATGKAAGHTGSGCTGWAGHLLGDGFACAGNMLAGPQVLEAITTSFDQTSEESHLAVRLVFALQQAALAGGDARGQQSAAVVVVRPQGGYGGHTDRWVDLRVDDHTQPITELVRLLTLHRLLFERPDPTSLVELVGGTAEDVRTWLHRLGVPVPNSATDPEQVWLSLDQWAGRENLEERMMRPGWVDPVVLDLLRGRAMAV
jgi:uncharacterized Ntn-hydrolase superfamily protein